MAVTHTRYGFRTAYLQRECVEDVAVCSAETGDYFRVGQLCGYTAASGTTPAYITKKSGNPAVGDLIVAQSDQSLGTGPDYSTKHVPVENRDYRYDDKVALTLSKAAAAAGDTDKVKKVAFFKVMDVNDLVKIG